MKILTTIKRHMKYWGPVGISIFALIMVLAAVALIYLRVPQHIGVPSPTGDTVINASGVDGYKVDEDVCHAYDVSISPAPDVGFVYTMKRETNGVTESVILTSDDKGEIINKEFNRHFFNTISGQAPEPAYVTDSGWKCVKEKAK